MRVAAIPFIWALFALACVAGFVLGVLALPFASSWSSRIFRAMDRATAALFGFSGERTLSAECGASDCRACRCLCAVLGILLGAGHCQKEAGKNAD